MKCTCPGLAIDKMRYQEVKDRCTVRWSVVVQCRYWATLHVLEYLIGARYMKCTCPGLMIGKMKYHEVKDRCTVSGVLWYSTGLEFMKFTVGKDKCSLYEQYKDRCRIKWAVL